MSEGNDNERRFDQLVKEIQSLEKLIAEWDNENHRLAVQALRNAIDALHKEALSRMIAVFREDAAAVKSFKEAATDACVYAVLRHHRLVKPSLYDRVDEALKAVRPSLHSHGGDIELLRIEGKTAIIRLLGSCNGCLDWGSTFKDGVEKSIKEACPEIEEIQCINVSSLLESNNPALARFTSRKWVKISGANDIPVGSFRVQELEGASVLLFRGENKLACYQNACSHMGLPLDNGHVQDGVITCPFHGLQYELESGQCLSSPELTLQSLLLRVTDGELEVRLN